MFNIATAFFLVFHVYWCPDHYCPWISLGTGEILPDPSFSFQSVLLSSVLSKSLSCSISVFSVYIPPPHTHSLTPFDQRTKPSTSSPCSLWMVQMPASPSCRAPRPPPRTVPYSPGQLLFSHISVSPLHCLHFHCPGLVCSACPSPSHAVLVLLPAIEEGRGDTHSCSVEQALDLKSWLVPVFRRSWLNASLLGSSDAAVAEQTGSPALGGLRHSCTFRKGFPAVACLFTRLCSRLNLLSPLPLHFPLHHVGLTSPFNFFFNFKIFFFMQPRGPFLKSALNLLQYCFWVLFVCLFVCFNVLVSWSGVPWSLSSPARNRTCTLALEGDLTHWTTGGVPVLLIYPLDWPWLLFIHRP